MLNIFCKKEGQKGFTLIELMIVIAVIGLLVAIAIPQFVQYRKKSYVAAVNSDCKNAYTAALGYYADHIGVKVDTAALAVGGYSQTLGVSTEVTSWSDEVDFVIICTGASNWGLGTPNAVYAVNNGVLNVTPAAAD